jgi:hypothetical protein
MCLLTFIPDYVIPPEKEFAVAAMSNPDGFGYAILESDRIVSRRGMNFERVFDMFCDDRRVHQGPALFHFRWATHGTTSSDNCHPFMLGGDPNTVLAHNGILPIELTKGDTRSDTRVFAESLFPSLGGVEILDDLEYFAALEKWCGGNKLVFLTNNDDAKSNWYIMNEELGHWKNDMWWSNHSYVHIPVSSYGSGWSSAVSSYVSYSTQAGNDCKFDLTDAEEEAIVYDMMVEELEQMSVFTTKISDEVVMTECYTCGAHEYYEVDEIVTHCSECCSCLMCGQSHKCNCWMGTDAWLGAEREAEYEYDAI